MTRGVNIDDSLHDICMKRGVSYGTDMWFFGWIWLAIVHVTAVHSNDIERTIFEQRKCVRMSDQSPLFFAFTFSHFITFFQVNVVSFLMFENLTFEHVASLLCPVSVEATLCFPFAGCTQNRGVRTTYHLSHVYIFVTLRWQIFWGFFIQISRFSSARNGGCYSSWIDGCRHRSTS